MTLRAISFAKQYTLLLEGCLHDGESTLREVAGREKRRARICEIYG